MTDAEHATPLVDVTLDPTAATLHSALTDALLLPLALLKPNAYNRKRYDPAKMADLVASVAKLGVLQPIVVRHVEGAKAGHALYEIVAGERRWRACTQAGLTAIPAMVRRMTDLEVMELLLVENREREDMNALDEANVLQQMLRKPDGLQGYATVEELAARIGRSRVYVFQRLKLLTLCDSAREALLAGELEASHALIIARIPSHADQALATKRVLHGFNGQRMSVRDAQEYVHREYMLDLAKAVFKISDADLVPAAGSCNDCPKRTGANPDLFADVKKGDTCTDQACYGSKLDAHRAQAKQAAEAEGKTVISGAAAKKAKPQNYQDLKGLLKLDEVHHKLHSDKTLRKLLGKSHTLEVLLFEDPHTHLLYDVVREAEALAVLKQAGVLQRASMPGRSASERDNERKAKAETAWRTEVARVAVEVAPAVALESDEARRTLMVEMAALLWARMESDACKKVDKLMGWTPLPGSSYDKAAAQALHERMNSLNPGQFAQYIVACVAAREMHCNEYSLHSAPARLLRVAKVLNVDVAGIQKKLRAESLARVPGKMAPAKPAPTKRASNPVLTPTQALAAAVQTNVRGKGIANPAIRYRYRDPATGDTWSGRGLKPKWLVARLADGNTLDTYLV